MYCARTFVLRLLLSLFLCGAFASFGQTDPNRSGAAPVSPDDALAQKLISTIVDADFAAVDFDTIIDGLRELHDLNIQVAWDHLEQRGVRRDKRLEVRLKQISLATLLDNILREADPTGLENLGYQIDNGVLVVSTEEALSRNALVRTYDITDLIQSGYADRRFFNTPVLTMELTGRERVGGEAVPTPGARRGGGFGGGGGGRGGGSRGNIYEAGDEYAQRSVRMERAREVVDLIIATASPDEWVDNGGEIASVRLFNDVLIVRHTMNGHREVQAVLDMVRSTRPIRLDADAVIVRMRADKCVEWRKRVGAGFPRLTPEQFEEIMMAEGEASVIFRGSTSGRNGSRLWFSALTQRDVLVETQGVVSDNSSAFDPVAGFSTEGLELIALPVMTADRSQVALNVNLAWIPTAEIRERAIVLAPGTEAASIDQVTTRMRSVSTTVDLELGEAIALSIPSQLPDGGQAAETEDWLLIRVHPPGR